MAHFAQLGIDNIVLRVIVVHNNELLDESGVEQESKGQEFCRNLFGGTWVQTSYNNNFRKNYAGEGFTYDVTRDAFIPPKPYNSWILDEESCTWVPPVAYPQTGTMYIWSEEVQNWQPMPAP